MSSLPLAELSAGSGFQADPRFAPGLAARPEPVEREDPLTRAWEDGHAAGLAEAQATTQAEDAARSRIGLVLARLDADQQEGLRQKLFATVEALCAAAIAPLALDREMLALRVERAAAMLARADDDKILRLHPEDLALIAKQLPDGLATLPDPALERGELRIETAAGGVEDGPAHWRRALAEALAQC